MFVLPCLVCDTFGRGGKIVPVLVQINIYTQTGIKDIELEKSQLF